MLSRDVNGTRISRVPKKFPVPGKKNSQTRILGKCTVAYWSAGDIILQRLPAQSVWSAPADAFICTQMLLLPPLASLTPIQTARWAVYRRWSTMTGVIRNRIKQSVIKSMLALFSPLSCSSTTPPPSLEHGRLYGRPWLDNLDLPVAAAARDDLRPPLPCVLWASAAIRCSFSSGDMGRLSGGGGWGGGR